MNLTPPTKEERDAAYRQMVDIPSGQCLLDFLHSGADAAVDWAFSEYPKRCGDETSAYAVSFLAGVRFALEIMIQREEQANGIM